MHSLIALPIVAPNWKGAYVSGDPSKGEVPEGATPYPPGTQTHAYVHPGSVLSIIPEMVGLDGTPRPGCLVYLSTQERAVYCQLSARETVALLKGADS